MFRELGAQFRVIKNLPCLWWPIPSIWRFGPVSLICTDQKNELVPSLLLKPISLAMHMPTGGEYCCLVPSPIIPEHLQILRVSLTHPRTMLLHMSIQVYEQYCVQICLSIHTCKSIIINTISPVFLKLCDECSDISPGLHVDNVAAFPLYPTKDLNKANFHLL